MAGLGLAVHTSQATLIDAQRTSRRRGEPPWRSRRKRLARRAIAVAVAVAVIAGLALLAVRLLADTERELLAEQFGRAWAAQDWSAMYGMLDSASRDDVEEDEFEDAYLEAAATATTQSVAPGDAREESDGEVVLPITTTTDVWGPLTGDLRLPVGDRGVEWAPHLVFPGLREGEELRRRTGAPDRAPLLAKDGTVLAEGDPGERTSELGLDGAAVAGTIAPPTTREERESLFARGFPPNATVGLTGLERIFEVELAGTPGGILRAGDREVAASEPQPAPPVRTTIDPDLQSSAVGSLSGLGGIVVVDATNGRIRALAGGTATTAQPPGSTFKIVTTTAALEDEVVTPETEFPVETAALIDGVTIDNAGQAACGGSFTTSFAESCNSVFAPLGVDVGAERLVEVAERYGVNQPPTLPSVDTSTMPEPDEFESDLELGATAIGQGRLLMTPIRLAAVSQTIANDGRLVEPTLLPGDIPERRRVTSRGVADTIEELMVGVTAPGATGERAAIGGVTVAGKTGTAELGEDITEHAWFTAFAPAGRRPELAVAVMIANGGSGGEVAAPVAKTVLEAGL